MSNVREFWEGSFGDEYTERNVGLEESNYNMFEKIFLKHDKNNYPIEWTGNIKSIVELGSGSGMNIRALKMVFKDIECTAVEINKKACEELKKINGLKIYNMPIEDVVSDGHDLVLTKGVLIHVPPEKLQDTYDVIYNSSKKYILICEYYNPTPVEVLYRGNAGKMWKRDFCGEIMDKYSDLKLIDYGFEYHRGENKLDDITWFLLSK